MNCRKYLFFLSGFFILDLWVSDFSVIYLIIISLCNNFGKDEYLPFIILSFPIYRKVYRTQVPRNTEDLKKESNKVAKRNLREGDLVFFTSSRSKNKVAHVGIYLKNGKFIHSSTSKGVIVSNLNENYYTKHWISGGRIR